ncbi:conserved hypothetical protein [Tenacibaculum sp. 190524A05c]|uniref:adenylosuccinate lyase n=1 Tax=Tenacibaculum platacis TaxID=3137852 RepID=UPI0031FB11B2
MSIDFLISVLHSMENPKRVNRNNAANIVLEQPELIKPLVDLTFDVNNKLSIKAAWILEWICTHHGINHVLPYLNTFTKGLQNLQFDGALRTCAKICEHLATAYTNTSNNKTKETITNEQITLIIETGFDWLITEQKIAVKAYTMNTLYLFGKHKDWVHPELEHIIRTKVIHESKGCTSRGKKILQLLAKHANS